MTTSHDGLLLEGAARHLAHLEGLQAAATLGEPVMVCHICYVPADEHTELLGYSSPTRDHNLEAWPIDQVLIKLRALIRRQQPHA